MLLCYGGRVRSRPGDGAAVRVQAFWHSSAHLLGQALELEFGADLTIGPSLDEGFYYDCYLGTDRWEGEGREEQAEPWALAGLHAASLSNALHSQCRQPEQQLRCRRSRLHACGAVRAHAFAAAAAEADASVCASPWLWPWPWLRRSLGEEDKARLQARIETVSEARQQGCSLRMQPRSPYKRNRPATWPAAV